MRSMVRSSNILGNYNSLSNIYIFCVMKRIRSELNSAYSGIGSFKQDSNPRLRDPNSGTLTAWTCMAYLSCFP